MRAAFMTDVNAVEVRETEEPKLDPRGAIPVSYTHLTLPTNSRV